VLLFAPLAAQTTAEAPAEVPDSADLARLIHKAVVTNMPEVYEDKSGWGHTIPLPERLRLPRLKRTIIQVGDRMEVPSGTWHKLRLKLEEPDRNLSVRVRSFKRLETTKYRVVVETDAALKAEADVQRWRNGLELADLTGRADVRLIVRVECDATTRFATVKGSPRLVLEPDFKDIKLTLKEFTAKDVTFRRAGVTIGGDPVEAVGDEVKGVVQSALKSMEPDLKKRSNEAAARALKEGKELLPVAEALKAVAPLLTEK
jgi:hypothetical protein